MRKIYYNSILARLLLWRKGYDTAMFFGFICTKRKKTEPLDTETVNHEAIHVEQYVEVTYVAAFIAFALSYSLGWSVCPFIVAPAFYYIVYFVEAGISWAYHRLLEKLGASEAADKAYYASMFEMEAYENEEDADYIGRRHSFEWIRYFGKI